MNKKPKTKLGDPRQYIQEITRSNTYLEKMKGTRTRSERASLIANCAIVHLTGEADRFKSMEELSRDLFGTAYYFIDASLQLDENKAGNKLSYNKRRELKKDTIRFNQTVREIFDSYPRISEEDVIRFVVDSQLLLRGRGWSEYSRARTKEVMTGMVMEIAYEDALWRVPGVVDVAHANMEEELKGTDLIITFEDGNTLQIDIKTSQRGVDEALASGNIAVKSPFLRDDIRNRRVLPKRLEEELPGITNEIYRLKSFYEGNSDMTKVG